MESGRTVEVSMANFIQKLNSNCRVFRNLYFVDDDTGGNLVEFGDIVVETSKYLIIIQMKHPKGSNISNNIRISSEQLDRDISSVNKEIHIGHNKRQDTIITFKNKNLITIGLFGYDVTNKLANTEEHMFCWTYNGEKSINKKYVENILKREFRRNEAYLYTQTFLRLIVLYRDNIDSAIEDLLDVMQKYINPPLDSVILYLIASIKDTESRNDIKLFTFNNVTDFIQFDKDGIPKRVPGEQSNGYVIYKDNELYPLSDMYREQIILDRLNKWMSDIIKDEENQSDIINTLINSVATYVVSGNIAKRVVYLFKEHSRLLENKWILYYILKNNIYFIYTDIVDNECK